MIQPCTRRDDRFSHRYTEVAANKIKALIGGDLFQIETEHPYSTDYHTCIKESIQELYEQASTV